ncbi:MAG: thioredoxin domain-containing protein [Gemmatimonadetes bacterium]|nr:thioredoxin domain-containing protein [Gemmatimonadota bacterium]MYI46957.1 thioredoxin domain-containing protein [Gemmatimonadota bacterium]
MCGDTLSSGEVGTMPVKAVQHRNLGPEPEDHEMSKSRTALETTATVLLTAAAVAVASVYVYGQIAGRPGARPQVAEDGEIENWGEDTALGIRIGPANARMVVTEFMDFTCPFCAMVVPVVDSLLSRYPSEVALVFQHFPLGGRPLSIPSAVAAECAERQDRFEPMYRLLFAEQDSLGSKDWAVFAEEAGIPDLAAFEECMKLPADSFARIDAGRELGLRRNVRGTPTLYVNGRRFGGRSFEEFREVAEQLGIES